MISVESRGRLGNHMFQFAFGVGAAARLGTDFAMDVSLLDGRFALEPWRSPLRRASRAVRYRARRRFAPYPVVKVPADAEPDRVIASLADGTHYAGFFQSEAYFGHASAAVRAALSPTPRVRRTFERRYGDVLARPYVCCHVRRTDYLTWNEGVALPASYYRACLAELAPPDETPVVLVGDEPEWLAGELDRTRDLRVERNEEVVDLLLLANAAGLVVSNSSFAWWGAWLRRRSDARVLAPRHWLGFRTGREWPPRVIPAGWTQIAVEPPA